MADFTPKKLSTEKSKAKGGLAEDNTSEHQEPPTLYLEHHHLAKLGMTKMPAVGTKIKISGLAHVGSTSEDQDRGDGGGPRRRMTLHMHQMETGTGKQGSEVADEKQAASGAKAEMDKALSRELGGAKGKNAEGAQSKLGKSDATPRGSNGPRGQA
jgi:hypothetical protein